eukprot:TRINITY_DN492_c0_g1_i1.p1 TRINITY_DN492_c0_g1~~TRINITY_DN492_c0_g1_i1.p1  ORF type:complete len:190 (-),score=111.44 TRINITY_DN492_c0_g1_i1:202-771(-)
MSESLTLKRSRSEFEENTEQIESMRACKKQKKTIDDLLNTSFDVEGWKQAEEEEYVKDEEFVLEKALEEAEENGEEYDEIVLEDSKETEDETEDENELLELVNQLVPENVNLDDGVTSIIASVGREYMMRVFESAQLIATKIGERDTVLPVDIAVAAEIMKQGAIGTTFDMPGAKQEEEKSSNNNNNEN